MARHGYGCTGVYRLGTVTHTRQNPRDRATGPGVRTTPLGGLVMAQATPPPPARTGTRISGACQLDYGHRFCSPGPVMVRDVQVLPQSCFCSCHKEGDQ